MSFEHTYYFSRKHRSFNLFGAWKQHLEDGDDPNEEWDDKYDGRRVSPLFSAVLDEDLDLVGLLLCYKAELERHNQQGRTVLQEAVVLARHDLVLLLVQNGAHLETPIASDLLAGGTALHLAVMEGVVDITTTLLENGADASASTRVGWTPVHIAVLDRQMTILETLLTKTDLSTAASRPVPGTYLRIIQEFPGDVDAVALSLHLVEHGARETYFEHLYVFLRCLQSVYESLDASELNPSSLSKVLIRDTHALLTSQAGTPAPVNWSRNLCDSCRLFESQDAHNACKTYEHSVDRSSLVSSAGRGCNFCQLLESSLEHRACVLHEIETKWLEEFGVSPKVRLRLSRRQEKGRHLSLYQLVVVAADEIAFVDFDHVQKHINAAVAMTGPSDIEGTGSDRSLAVARAWMLRCEDEHSSCQRSELCELPTRVIDVGTCSDDTKIYVSARERARYAVLSYCWGQGQNSRLTTSNLDSFALSLSFTELPRTIADAIYVARKMGIRYLWVDSLCILQDSEADLKHELSYMGDIFVNACLTIAAKDSPSCASGLFKPRTWTNSALVLTELHVPSRTIEPRSEVSGRSQNTRTSSINRLIALAGPYNRIGEDKPVLETRGWTLQEELLSRRTLVCSRDELSWTCIDGSCNERHPKEQSPSQHSWQDVVRHALGSSATSNPDQSKKGPAPEYLVNHWFKAVEDFLRRDLSEPRDRFTALAGVQTAIGHIIDDRPLVGIWSGQYLALSLLWYISDDSRKAAHSHNTDQRSSPVNIPVPSWSWLNHSSRSVKYVKHPSCTDSTRHWVWHHRVEYFPTVVSVASVVDAGHDGATGFVGLRGKLLREAGMDCEKYVVKDFLNNPPSSRSGKEAINFVVYPDIGPAATVSGSDDGRWLFLVRTNQFIPGSKDRGYKYDIESHLLLLEQISTEDTEDDDQMMDFRRVGIVVTRSWANRWLRTANEVTIRLF